MGPGMAGFATVLLLLITLSGAVDARSLLHKHHHHGGKHGHCKTIAQVLHETPSLSRFAKAFDDAHVPFITGLVNDPHARATLLAVQDEHLGTGDTVFDEAAIRFQQHTIMDRVKTCKAKDGDVYSTLAGTKLTVRRDAAANKGRKLQQVSTAMTSLLAVLPGDAEDVPKSVRPVSNAAFAVPEAKEAAHGEHSKHAKAHKHGKHHGCKGKKHWKGKHHWKAHGEWNDDDDDHAHKKQGKGHGNHHWKHHAFSAKDMVAHALVKAEHKAAKHGALFLQSNVTSQRVKVLGSVHACEGAVLIVSAFLNAPPTPDPVVVLAAQRPYTPHQAGHRHHHGEGHAHHHSWLGCLKHAMKVWQRRLEHLFSHGKPYGKRCHGKHRHGKHAKIEKHDPPNDPELLAYYAAHERAQGEHGVKAQAALAGAVQAAVSKVVDATPQQVGRVELKALPARVVTEMQRLVDPRAITFQEVNHTPLVLPSAAAEAWRDLRNWLAHIF
jgi:hypothetical protein